MLRIYEVVIGVAGEVASLCDEVAQRDADLARQMRRAMTSVALNLAEGAYSRGGNRRARYLTAMGSAREVLACLEVARAMRVIADVDARTLDRLDHVVAVLVRLVAR